jgi:AcrR family transcriptional regulator
MNMSSPATEKRPYRMSARSAAAAATAERLQEAAWEQFSSRPYEEVRLPEIAAAAGVAVQTLHNHFGSKDGLLVAAFAWFGQSEVAGRDAAPVGRVGPAIEVLFDRYEAHGPAILRMLAQEERVAAIKAMTDLGRAYHRDWAERTFAPQLRGLRGGARRRRLAAVTLATDLLAWKLLRGEIGLGREEAERVMAEMVEPPGRAQASARSVQPPPSRLQTGGGRRPRSRP